MLGREANPFSGSFTKSTSRVTMRKYILTTITVLPLLLSFSHAAQSWPVDPSAQPYGFPSEESGTGAYLAVDISDITSGRLGALKLNEEHAVEITLMAQA